MKLYMAFVEQRSDRYVCAVIAESHEQAEMLVLDQFGDDRKYLDVLSLDEIADNMDKPMCLERFSV